jgi:hypothetical protein
MGYFGKGSTEMILLMCNLLHIGDLLIDLSSVDEDMTNVGDNT